MNEAPSGGEKGRWFGSPLAITGVAFLIRLGYLLTSNLVSGAIRPILGREAINIAESVATHGGFASPFLNASGPTGPTAWLTPVFPYLLSVPMKIWGAGNLRAWLAILLLNGSFSALTCWPLFHAGKQLAGSRFGALAAWVWALFPVAIWEPYAAIWYTSLSALLIAAILWTTLLIRHAQSVTAWAGFGVLWGAELLTNASFASVLPFVFIWLGRELYASKRAWIRLPLIAGFAVVLTCAPWMVRNYVVLHAFVPLRSNFGFELWRFNGGKGLHPLSSREELNEYVHYGEIGYMIEKKQKAFAYIPSHLHAFAIATRWRIIFFWIVGWRGNNVFFALSNMLLTGLVPLGLLFLYSYRREEFWLFLTWPLVFPLVYYVTIASILYRHAMDPVIITIAAFAIYCILNRALGRQSFTRPVADPSILQVSD
jgi:4-amino-4-deoxy-L-arabinose transferase-like glycosyltransferase